MAVLASALEAAGVRVWLDDRLVAGSHFDSAIEEALAEAAKVIVAWTPASIQSRWVRAEAGEGLERGILIPVVLKPTRIPLEFKRVHTVDLTSWVGDTGDHMFVQLLAALESEARVDRQLATVPSTRPRKVLAEQVTAEVVYLKEAHAEIRILVRSGLESVLVAHKGSNFYQQVTINDEPIYGSYFFRENHKFELSFGATKSVGELTLYRSRLGFLKEFSLRVDGKEVLRKRLSWGGLLLGLSVALLAGAIVGLAAAFIDEEKYFSQDWIGLALGLTIMVFLVLFPMGLRGVKRWRKRRQD